MHDIGPTGVGSKFPLSEFKILVADDDSTNRRLLRDLLALEGHAVILAADGESALRAYRVEPADLVLLDLRMPGLDGIETLRRIKMEDPAVPVLILTAHGDIATAVEATKLGAEDFLVLPIEPEKLVRRVKFALERHALVKEAEALRSGEFLKRLAGPSASVGRVLREICDVANSNFTVLISGETGTGKELVARALHEESGRHARPFLAVDCAALPESLAESELFGHEKGAFTGADRRTEGCFQVCNKGTLFLDEIGNLSVPVQAKLLRVLQERELRPVGDVRSYPIDVRIIAASNEPLPLLVSTGRFRADLYYRIAEFHLHVPPLRERVEDIPLLARRFLGEAALDLNRPIFAIEPEALGFLASYSWPGNVRELRNLMRAVAIQCRGAVVEREMVQKSLSLTRQPASRPDKVGPPDAIAPLRGLRDKALAEVERKAIKSALHLTNGNKSAAARVLQIDIKTLYAKMRAYDLLDSAVLRPLGIGETSVS